MPGSITYLKQITVYLCLGSNMGDRAANIHRTERQMGKKLVLQTCSSLFDTAPVGNTRQPRFLNRVCGVSTALSPLDLLGFVKDIEKKMGRKPGPPDSPRPITATWCCLPRSWSSRIRG